MFGFWWVRSENERTRSWLIIRPQSMSCLSRDACLPLQAATSTWLGWYIDLKCMRRTREQRRIDRRQLDRQCWPKPHLFYCLKQKQPGICRLFVYVYTMALTGSYSCIFQLQIRSLRWSSTPEEFCLFPTSSNKGVCLLELDRLW
jgi:hypothetical protein